MRLSNSSPTSTSMPSSSRNSRARHCSKVSSGSRLPPGNSHSPPEVRLGVALGDEQLAVAKDEAGGDVDDAHGWWSS